MRQLIAQIPGGRRVTIVVIENTVTGSTNVDAAAPSAVIAGTRGQYTTTIIRPSAATPLEVAREALRDAPSMRRTPVEWSKAFDGEITVRELKRALDEAVLQCEERGAGRGHGAIVVTPAAMISYLQARQDAVSSRGKRPAWFARVVKEATHAS